MVVAKTIGIGSRSVTSTVEGCLLDDQPGETGTAMGPAVVWDQRLWRSYSERTIGAGPEGGKYPRGRGGGDSFRKEVAQ